MGYLELLLRPDLGKRAYRLKCRFLIEAFPAERALERAKVAAAAQFIRDLHLQGWEYVPRYGFELHGPFPHLEPVDIQVVRPPTARSLLPLLQQGARFLAGDQQGTQAQAAPRLRAAEFWEYEIRAVFVHATILTEQPDAHEVTYA